MAGDLVDLSADGAAGPHGDNAFAEVGYAAGLQIGAEICHGLRLTLAADLKGTAAAGVEIARFLEAIVTLEAGAKLRAELVTQMSANLTDSFGLTCAFAAEARAYVRASLALDVRLGELLNDARTLPLERRLLDRLLERAVLRAGIQGTAEIAAAAHGMAVCRLDMGGRGRPPAGIDIRAGGGAGLLYGTSCDFFFMARLEDLPGYFRDIRNDIIDTFTDEIPSPLARMGLRMITDVVINTMDDNLSSIDAMTGTLRNLLLEMTLDTAVAAYETALRGFLDDLVDEIQRTANQTATAALDDLAEQSRAATDIDAALRILSEITELAFSETLPQAASLAELSTAAHAFWKLCEPDAPIFDDPMPSHVQTRMRNLGITDDHLRSSAEAAVLLAGSAGISQLDVTIRALPGGDLLMDLVAAANAAGVSLADLLVMLAPDASPEARGQLAGLAAVLLADFLETEVEPALESAVQKAVAEGAIPQELADMVIQIAAAGRRIFLPGLLAANGPNQKQELDMLFRHAQQVLSRILLRQAALLGASVTHRASQGFASQMDRMVARIQSGESDFSKRLAALILEGLSNAMPVDLSGRQIEAELADVLDQFAVDMFRASRRAFGPATFTEARLDDLATAIIALMSGAEGPNLDYRTESRENLDRELLALRECGFFPDVSWQAAKQLADVQRDIGMAQFRLIAQDMPPLVDALVQDVARLVVATVVEAVLEGVRDALLEVLEVAQAAIDSALNLLNDASKEFEDKAAEIIAGMDRLARELDAYVTRLIDGIDARLKIDELDGLAAFFGTLWDRIRGTSDEEKARAFLAEMKSRAKARLSVAPGASGTLSPLLQDFQDRLLVAEPAQRDNFEAEFNALLKAVLPQKDLDALAATQVVTDQAAGIFGPLDVARTESVAINDRRSVLRDANHARTVARGNLSRARSDVERLSPQLVEQRARLDPTPMARAAETVRITSPAAVDPDKSRLPIFADWVYIEVDMGDLGPEHLTTRARLPFDTLMGQDPSNPTSIRQAARRLARNGAFDAVPHPMIDVRLFHNGAELETGDLRQDGTRLGGYISGSQLHRGSNDLLLAVTFPGSAGIAPVIRHVTFWCAPGQEVPPSDGLQINRNETVINTLGNDHADATRSDQRDREVVVITNATDTASIDLKDYALSDAYGHAYVFDTSDRLKPGLSTRVFVGADGPDIEHNWLSSKSGTPRAILNNEGECLRLRAPDGIIVSQTFTGNPAANRWINRVAERKA